MILQSPASGGPTLPPALCLPSSSSLLPSILPSLPPSIQLFLHLPVHPPSSIILPSASSNHSPDRLSFQHLISASVSLHPPIPHPSICPSLIHPSVCPFIHPSILSSAAHSFIYHSPLFQLSTNTSSMLGTGRNTWAAVETSGEQNPRMESGVED